MTEVVECPVTSLSVQENARTHSLQLCLFTLQFIWDMNSVSVLFWSDLVPGTFCIKMSFWNIICYTSSFLGHTLFCVQLEDVEVWSFAAQVQADSGLSEEEEEEGETSQDARDSDEEFQPAPWEKGKGNPLPEQSSIR